MHRLFFAIMIAAAMLFAPLAAGASAAVTAAPTGHHGQMTKDHCGPQPEDRDGQQSKGESCCIATCAAIAIAPASPAFRPAFAASPDRLSPENRLDNFLAKLPTPPPRRA